MILLLCVVLFFVPFVCTSLPSLNDTYILTLDVRDSPSCNTRTLLDILSSCGLTLFTCTWTAIHLDIPGVGEGIVAITFRHLFFMLMAFLAPEIVVAWAAWQLLCARQVTRDFNVIIDASVIDEIPNSNRSSIPRWTLTHGFFACMGGFVLCFDDGRRVTLTPEELLGFVREGSVEIPPITEADINNRSQGDLLTKCIAILQLLWFIVQLIARYAQNLPVTLLEIDTLGVAVLTCIAYGLWLKKPKNVQLPHIIHWKSKSVTPPEPHTLTNDKGHSSLSNFRSLFFNNTGRISESAPSGLRLTRRNQIPLNAARISGIVFGMIHCIGWNFLFPKHAEQILWRVASIGIPCTLLGILMWFQSGPSGLLAPVLVLLPSGLIVLIDKHEKALDVIMATEALFGYLLARIMIIVLMMMSFRSLPPGTYDTVAWSEYILHVDL